MKAISHVLLFCMGLVSLPLTAQQIDTRVMTRTQAVADKGEGWVFYSYFTGDSYGIEKTLTGMAVIQPGFEIHPPHVHADEEYLVITKGEGEWSVKGETFKASTGDMLYASPWDEHGVKNTGDEPLVFVVFKWHSKNNAVPPQPESVNAH